MDEAQKDYEAQELVTIKLPRQDFELLRKIIEREEAHQWFVSWFKNHWFWIVGAGVLTYIGVYEFIVKAVTNG